MHASLLAAAILIAAQPLRAQADTTRLPSFYVGAGVSQFDLSGTGSDPAFAVRANWSWRRHFLVEAGASLARPNQAFGQTTLLIPEGQLQAQLGFGNFHPYLGVGGGIAMDIRDETFGGWDTEPTVSAAAGVRLWFRRWLGVRAELRVRGIGDEFEGSAAEWTAGLTWKFK